MARVSVKNLNLFSRLSRQNKSLTILFVQQLYSYEVQSPGNTDLFNTHDRLMLDRPSGVENQEHRLKHEELGEETQSDTLHSGLHIEPPNWLDSQNLGEGTWERLEVPLASPGYYTELTHVLSQLKGHSEVHNEYPHDPWSEQSSYS